MAIPAAKQYVFPRRKTALRMKKLTLADPAKMKVICLWPAQFNRSLKLSVSLFMQFTNQELLLCFMDDIFVKTAVLYDGS